MNFNDDIIITKDNAKDIMSNMKTGGVFMNSKCLFVEYYDIIKAPWYILLSVIHQNETIRPIIKTSLVSYLDTNSLFEWYCNRKHRNFLYDLAAVPLDKVDYDQILDILMRNEIFYTVDTELNAVQVIKTALKEHVVEQVVIYNEDENLFIREDIKRIFGNNPKVKFMHGDFSDVLKSIPNDSSYMLSDFNKAITMADENRLSYASLILPYDFEYNFVKDGKGEKVPAIDFAYLGKDHLFKLNFFNACYQ